MPTTPLPNKHPTLGLGGRAGQGPLGETPQRLQSGAFRGSSAAPGRECLPRSSRDQTPCEQGRPCPAPWVWGRRGLPLSCPPGRAQPGSPSLSALCFILGCFLLLLFCFRFIMCLLADLFVYSPPSPANFPTWIAFIHESPPFLSLTRARSNCRREEARTLFPLFKVSRSVPGPGASSVLLPTPAFVSCSMFAPSPTLSRVQGSWWVRAAPVARFSGCL